MDWNPLINTLEDEGEKFTIVRPGLTLFFNSPRPVQELGPTAAAALERYLAFIPPGGVDHYLASSGEYKKINPRTLPATLKRLREVDADTEWEEFHFTQGVSGGVGDYGAHFNASNRSDKDDLPLETNVLLLEFPTDQLTRTPPDAFLEFAVGVANLIGVNSGVGGYAFKYPQMIFDDEAREFIAAKALRYLGLDISYLDVREDLAGRIHNVSWLTFLGPSVLDELGGQAALRKALPKDFAFIALQEGLVIRAAEQPMVGDVNRGAPDVGPLRKLAAVTKPVRLDTDYLGVDDDLFAGRWLKRLD